MTFRSIFFGVQQIGVHSGLCHQYVECVNLGRLFYLLISQSTICVRLNPSDRILNIRE